jgi:hypothetical protein
MPHIFVSIIFSAFRANRKIGEEQLLATLVGPSSVGDALFVQPRESSMHQLVAASCLICLDLRPPLAHRRARQTPTCHARCHPLRPQNPSRFASSFP